MEKFASLEEIEQIRKNIDKYIVKTPILYSEHLNQLTGANLFFKCENFQKTGSFKARGASNSVHKVLNSDQKQIIKGFTTHSSGNHAAALAYASKMMGSQATIVMPSNSSKTKIKNVQYYEALVEFCEPNDVARLATCQRIKNEKEYEIIPPYDSLDIIKGQATLALELFDQVQDPIDYIITPVGGGGLLSGTILTTKLKSPSTKVIGAEPELAGDAQISFRTGIRQSQFPPKTICDGLRTALGEINFEIIKEFCDDILIVTEEQILEALHLICNKSLKIIIEPSCSVPLAVVLNNKEQFKDKNVILVLTGGNIDIRDFHLLFE